MRINFTPAQEEEIARRLRLRVKDYLTLDDLAALQVQDFHLPIFPGRTGKFLAVFPGFRRRKYRLFFDTSLHPDPNRLKQLSPSETLSSRLQGPTMSHGSQPGWLNSLASRFLRLIGRVPSDHSIKHSRQVQNKTKEVGV